MKKEKKASGHYSKSFTDDMIMYLEIIDVLTDNWFKLMSLASCFGIRSFAFLGISKNKK